MMKDPFDFVFHWHQLVLCTFCFCYIGTCSFGFVDLPEKRKKVLDVNHKIKFSKTQQISDFEILPLKIDLP